MKITGQRKHLKVVENTHTHILDGINPTYVEKVFCNVLLFLVHSHENSFDQSAPKRSHAEHPKKKSQHKEVTDCIWASEIIIFFSLDTMIDEGGLRQNSLS